MSDNQTMDTNSRDLENDYSLWWLIVHTRRAMYRAREKDLFTYGITPEESAVLSHVENIDTAATPAEISRRLLRQPHSTSGLLDRMQKKGLINKVKDMDKKNLVRVTMTEKGRKVHEHSLTRESIYKILSVLSEEEHQQLWSCLVKLRDRALAEIGVKTAPPLPKPR